MFLKDKTTISAGSKRVYTDEGFLQVPARIARTGTQEYLAVEMGLTDKEPTETVVVYRPPEEVFKDDSLRSFANKPVTNDHPPVLVDAKNAKQFSVGMSGRDILKDGDFVVAELTITDADTIALVEQGKVELSNGYTADIDWVPGVSPLGVAYDGVQKNIKGNHIAVVSQGRAGPMCKVADSKTIKDEGKMAKVIIDGVEYEVTDQVSQAVAKLQKRVLDAEMKQEDAEEEAKKKEDEMEKEKEEAKKTEDSLKAKLDDALAKIPTGEALDKLVAERTALVDAVKRVMPSIKWEGKDAATLRREVVAAKCANVHLDSVSDDYIQARFDMLLETAPGVAILNDALNRAKSSEQTVLSVADEARAKFIERSKNAWKGESK